jgi:hypothetical protein
MEKEEGAGIGGVESQGDVQPTVWVEGRTSNTGRESMEGEAKRLHISFQSYTGA